MAKTEPTPEPSVVSFISDNGSSPHAGPITCKFVVVDDAEQRHLVLGPVADFPYHANLVAKFCDDRQLAYGWQQRPDLVAVFDPAVKIRGGGMLEIDVDNSLARFYGASRAYGYFRRADVERLTSGTPLFAGYEIAFSHDL